MKLSKLFLITALVGTVVVIGCNDDPPSGTGGTGGTGGGLGGSGGSDLVCDENKGVCFTGNGFAQLCADDSGNCFWYVSNDGICFSDEGDIQLCSPVNSDRISTVNGQLVSCGKCDDLDPTCTEEALALCDELFTGSQLPSCNECGDSTATRTE